MSLICLLEQPNLILQKPVSYFLGTEFPLLFFSYFKKRLKEVISVRAIDLEEVKLNDLKAELSLTFLGNKSLYWFGNIDDCSSKTKDDFFSLIKNYSGPNIIVFFTTEDLVRIEIQKFSCEIEKNNIQKLSEFLQIKYVDRVLKNAENLKLDQIILLSLYSNVIGSRSKEFVDIWQDKIIKTESSLFTLSSLFFTKDKKRFFEYWLKIKESYQDTFWTVFWLDQSFRAYWFLKYKNDKDFKNMKKISFKLPFSFINSDFKKNSLEGLSLLQSAVFQADCFLKQGLGQDNLEYSLVKYLNS